MTPTRKELTAAIQTARGIQEMARSGDFIKRPLLTEDRPTLVSVDAFSAAERFAALCEDILSAMPAPEPAPSLAETVYENIIKPHAEAHGSAFGGDNMPASAKRPAPEDEGDERTKNYCWEDQGEFYCRPPGPDDQSACRFRPIEETECGYCAKGICYSGAACDERRKKGTDRRDNKESREAPDA